MAVCWTEPAVHDLKAIARRIEHERNLLIGSDAVEILRIWDGAQSR
jgi:hypothetical protein